MDYLYHYSHYLFITKPILIPPFYYDCVGLAVQAQLSNPSDVALYQGYVFIADTDNHVIRVIDLHGIITVVCGTGYPGPPVENVTVLNTQVNATYGIVVDWNGNIYFSDRGNNVVRMIDTSYGAFDSESERNKWVVNTVVGTGNTGKAPLHAEKLSCHKAQDKCKI